MRPLYLAVMSKDEAVRLAKAPDCPGELRAQIMEEVNKHADGDRIHVRVDHLIERE